MKTCTRCGTSKPLSEFYNSARGKDGKYSYCRPCVASRGAAYKKANPEKTEEARKRWKLKNPEKLKEAIKRWKQKNTDKVNASRRRRYLKNPDKQREQSRVIKAKQCEQAADSYLKRAVPRLKNASPEHLAAYRETLLAKREAKEISKLIELINTEIENVQKTEHHG